MTFHLHFTYACLVWFLAAIIFTLIGFLLDLGNLGGGLVLALARVEHKSSNFGPKVFYVLGIGSLLASIWSIIK